MMSGMAGDPSTMLVLAAIALAEGLARVPAGSLVLRRVLNGSWQIEPLAGPGNRLRLVHWWSPWTEALVLSPGPHASPPLGRADLVSRLATIRAVRRAARMIGGATLILLIVGVPAAFDLAGAAGGLFALAGVITGQLALALLSWRGLRLLGASRRERLRSLPIHLNPFAAPALTSRLLMAAVSGATPATVARTILPPATWAEWFRPQAYDARVARALDLAGELEAAESAVTEVLAQRPTMPENVLWCPRCASTYQAGTVACADCGVPLLAASESLPLIARLRSAPGLG